MTTADVLRRLRLFLLSLSLLLFAGTLVEVWLVKHTKDPVQWFAFIFAGLGLLSVLLVLGRTRQNTVRVMRVLMTIVVLGSCFGVYEHISSNAELEQEIHPDEPTSQLMMKALGGSNPLLAPGTLAVAGLLAFAATYKHSIVADLPAS
jgi:hypothetical protein